MMRYLFNNSGGQKQYLFPAKKHYMVISKQNQLAHENTTWNRELEFFKQENAYLKTSLSVIIDSRDDKEFLRLAEYFQNLFLLKDELINELKCGILNHDEEIKHDLRNDKILNEILKGQEKLRKQMNYFETDFSRLKNEFNQLLTQYL
ncbi:MAG: hypothetical protein ABJA71_02010 [Ginsengibacter sp.]